MPAPAPEGLVVSARAKFHSADRVTLVGPGPSQLIRPWETSLTEKPNKEEKARPSTSALLKITGKGWKDPNTVLVI